MALSSYWYSYTCLSSPSFFKSFIFDLYLAALSLNCFIFCSLSYCSFSFSSLSLTFYPSKFFKNILCLTNTLLGSTKYHYSCYITSSLICLWKELFSWVPSDWFRRIDTRIKGQISTSIWLFLNSYFIRPVTEHNTFVVTDGCFGPVFSTTITSTETPK